MSDSLNDKKSQILKLVDEYVKEKQASKTWNPDKDWVAYSGDVYSSDEYIAGVQTLLDGWLVFGKNCAAFEQEFPQHLGKKYGSICNQF